MPKSLAIAAAAARRRHQCRSAAGAEEARQAVPVRRSRRHPLRGDPVGEDEAARGVVDGQGPAPQEQFEVAEAELAAALQGRARAATRHAGALTMKPIRLDGRSLTREQLVAVALWRARSSSMRRSCRRCSAPPTSWPSRSRREEPIYGVSTGFGSNADKLLGAHPPARRHAGRQARGRTLLEELQRQPDRHPRGLRRRAVRAGRGARDAGASASTR